MSGPSGRTRNKKQRTVGPDATTEILRRIHSSRSITKEEICHFFHIDRPACHGCRGNTKDSPGCFCGLVPPVNSTRKHGLWQKLADTIDSLGPDPSKELRSNQDLPSGLTNLGATCYVNSVLQCLYMNTAFRNGVFAAEAELVRTQPVLHQLARLFAQLHSGKKTSVDSAEFATTLELDNAIQQDGQEFLKLLLTLLERILAQSRVSEARNVVQNVFRGTFSYVTKCSCCGKESDASNQFVDFYELEVNVKGFAGLEESLDDYFSEEKLQGENQYFCQYCKGRVDATHSTRLRLLPPVLNFQLKRFVFNSKTASKKKVTSKFSFPNFLDMGSRVSPVVTEGSGREPAIYDLSAILVHKGNMANSGHYVAHIKDDRTGQWWKFDDEEVTGLGSHPLGETPSTNKDSASKDSAPSENSRESCSHINKNVLMSADAYMLMYSRRAVDLSGSCNPCLEGIVPTEGIAIRNMDISREQRARRSQHLLPEQLSSEVEELNDAFVNSCEAFKLMKDEEVKKIAERKVEVREILANAPVRPTASKICWILTEWLRTWADSLKPPPPIDNSQLLCEHKGVSHRKVHLMKCISETAWKDLQSKYGGGPELTVDQCCLECIYEDAEAAATADNFRSKRVAMKLMVENVMAGHGLEGQLYYVSKTWLMQWMRKKSIDAPSDADAGPTSAITCSHNGLLPEQAAGAKRQLVPEVLWSYFYKNAFHVSGGDWNGHKPYPIDTETCRICEAEMTQAVCKQEGLRATKMEQRQKQEAIYSGRSLVLVPKDLYYLVPSAWVMQWRAYLGASGKNVLDIEEPVGLEGFILSLLCKKHERLLFRPPLLTRTKRGELVQKTSPDDVFTVVSQEDWLFFCQQWDVDVDKGFKTIIDADDCDVMASNGEIAHAVDGTQQEVSELPVLRTEPEVCRQCIEDRESTDLIRKLSYVNGTITVDLVQGKEPPPSLLASSTNLDTERRTSKRARKTLTSGNKRVVLTVSGSTTIYHLKLLIWEWLGVVLPPYAFGFDDEGNRSTDIEIVVFCKVVKENQKVNFGRVELTDESSTLADVGILPGSQLWVSDTGEYENRDIAEELPEQHGQVEEGFRGTRLLDSSAPSFSDSGNGVLSNGADFKVSGTSSDMQQTCKGETNRNLEAAAEMCDAKIPGRHCSVT